ncbi:MAG: hemolysin family protein [Alphaproteobacteria bacterium]|nr:hemolysin family protein [Alphaproteobacteria bacterium]
MTTSDMSKANPDKANGGKAGNGKTNGGKAKNEIAGDPSTLFDTLRNWLGVRRERNGEDLRDSIAAVIEEHEGAGGAIDADERALLQRILKLHELSVEDVMVPRVDIVAVEEKTPLEAVVRLMTKDAHSRLPVYRRDLDDVTGMVHIKDVLAQKGTRRPFRLSRILRKVLFAAPSMKVLELLAQMRETRIHMALVVDEFGGIDGLVTIEDLVEEIVGDIEDEFDETEAPQMTPEGRGVMLADARVTIEDFEAQYGPTVSDEERDDIDTLGGLVAALAGRVPGRGELVEHPGGLEFEVVDADHRRVRKLRVRNLPPRKRPS